MGSQTDTVFVSGGDTIDDNFQHDDLAEVVDGEMTFLGFKGNLMVRAASAGGSGMIAIVINESGNTPTEPNTGDEFLEGHHQYRILWSLRVTFAAQADGAQMFIIPLDIKTKRRMYEGDEIFFTHEGTQNNVCAFGLSGKIMGLSRGGHWEAPT